MGRASSASPSLGVATILSPSKRFGLGEEVVIKASSQRQGVEFWKLFLKNISSLRATSVGSRAKLAMWVLMRKGRGIGNDPNAGKRHLPSSSVHDGEPTGSHSFLNRLHAPPPRCRGLPTPRFAPVGPVAVASHPSYSPGRSRQRPWHPGRCLRQPRCPLRWTAGSRANQSGPGLRFARRAMRVSCVLLDAVLH